MAIHQQQQTQLDASYVMFKIKYNIFVQMYNYTIAKLSDQSTKSSIILEVTELIRMNMINYNVLFTKPKLFVFQIEDTR